MNIHNIKNSEINKFVNINENDEKFENEVKKLFENKLSRPEWCFVAEKNERVYGRIGYWLEPEKKEIAHIFGFNLLCNENNIFQMGKKLINNSLEYMKNEHIKIIKVQTHSNDGKLYELSNKLYKSIGMENTQIKKSYLLNIKEYCKKSNNRFKYKSLKDVGRDTFINIIKDVSFDSLDGEDQNMINELGVDKAAEEHFDILKSIEYSLNNWFVGLKDKKIVGLVIPQKFDKNHGAINYIGVISEKRGQGYVFDLLDKGINNLISRGVNKIIADIDVNNFPMEKALNKIGFKFKNKINNYKLIL